MLTPPSADYEVLSDDQPIRTSEAAASPYPAAPVTINIGTVNVSPAPGYGYGYAGELYSNKSRALTLILAFFFGIIGAHCFYVGRVGRGLLFLFTAGLFGIGWIWDIIQIVAGRYRDGAGWLIAT